MKTTQSAQIMYIEHSKVKINDFWSIFVTRMNIAEFCLSEPLSEIVVFNMLGILFFFRIAHSMVGKFNIFSEILIAYQILG